MAMNPETVRQIVREELERLIAAVRELDVKVGAAAEATRGRALSVEEAAAYLGGLPVTTVRKLARNRDIGFLKVGRTTVFPVAALNEYIEKHTLIANETPWGLTEASLRTIRGGSPQDRVRRRTEAMSRLPPGY